MCPPTHEAMKLLTMIVGMALGAAAKDGVTKGPSRPSLTASLPVQQTPTGGSSERGLLLARLPPPLADLKIRYSSCRDTMEPDCTRDDLL